MKEINLLQKGIFNAKALDSRCKTRAVTKKEKILGHLIGPLGMIFIVNTIAALVEKFFMQMVGLTYPAADGVTDPMSAALGEQYQLVMMIIKFVGVGVALLNSWLVSHTACKQGRFRPWYLIYSLASVVIGALIFLFSPNLFGEAYWVYFFIMLACYNLIGASFFYVFRDNIVSVTTRDPIEKQSVSFMRKLCWTLISGILIGMIVNSVLVPFWLQDDISGYAVLMIVLSVLSLPLILMEYFYTKERVIEDANLESKGGNANKVPLKAQFKALFSNRFYMIMLVLTTLGTILDNFKGGNVQYYYIQYLLGGVENPSMQMIYQIVTGVPLGIGAFIIYPISKKVGVKNLSIGGYALVLVGSALGWMFPDQMVPALIGGFLRNFGWLPNSYILVMLTYYAFDDVEFRSGLRVEGLLGIGIIGAVQSLIYAPFAGGYESLLLQMGFTDNLDVMPVPPENVRNFMAMSFYLFDIILATAYVVLLPFVNVEKRMPQIKAELLKRKREAVLARGETWIEPEVQDALEREEAKKEHEENRIQDLQELCRKKGLDFETENEKYLVQKAAADKAWEEKQAEKKRKAEEKAAARAQKAQEKEARRIAALKVRCKKRGLDFEEENEKYFAAIERKKAEKQAEAEAWYKSEMQKYNAFRAWMQKDEQKHRA